MLQKKLDNIGNFMIKVSNLLEIVQKYYPSLDWSKSYISSAECVYLVGIHVDASNLDKYQTNMQEVQMLHECIKSKLDNHSCIDAIDYDGGFRITIECRVKKD